MNTNADEAEQLLLILHWTQWASRGVDGLAAQIIFQFQAYRTVQHRYSATYTWAYFWPCAQSHGRSMCEMQLFSLLASQSNLFDFGSFTFWDLILGLAVFKNQLTSHLCKDQLCMTFGRKSRRSDHWQLIILCLTLASLIVWIFAIPVPVSLCSPQAGVSQSKGC